MHYLVSEADTALALGSGDVPVLGTPRLIAWMEAATVRAAEPFLEPGQTTVGIAVGVEHDRPTPIGGSVDVVAETEDGPVDRRITFLVEATDQSGQTVATGEIERMVVDRDRFLRSTSTR